MTRLGFGLNVAPLIMKAIISTVLAQDATVSQAASVYIDDIFINEDCCICDPHQRTSGLVWTRMQRPRMVGKRHTNAGTGSREGMRQTAMETKKHGLQRPLRSHTTDNILFVWKACWAPSGVWLAPHGLQGI